MLPRAELVENVQEAASTVDLSLMKDVQEKRLNTLARLQDAFVKADEDGSGSVTLEELEQVKSERAKAASSIRQTSQGSFWAVSKPKFASKYAFESSRRDLHKALLCTALKWHFLLQLFF